MKGELLAPIGFIGLGTMGTPMALNLKKAGFPLLVWNRTESKLAPLIEAGAMVARTAEEVFYRCRVIILMLVDGQATDTVLARGRADFVSRVWDRTLVNMATIPPEYSAALASDVRAAGGRFVEAPVSGSRKPAEDGQLVCMIAGALPDISAVFPLISAMCRNAVNCGEVPQATYMKLAVNLFLSTLVTGLAEAVHFAEQQHLRLPLLEAVLNAGPMASAISQVKLTKFVNQDFSVQASITNVRENVRLIIAAARTAGLASPLLDICDALYEEAKVHGHGEEDMAAVIRAIEHRTTTLR